MLHKFMTVVPISIENDFYEVSEYDEYLDNLDKNNKIINKQSESFNKICNIDDIPQNSLSKTNIHNTIKNSKNNDSNSNSNSNNNNNNNDNNIYSDTKLTSVYDDLINNFFKK